MQRIKAGLQQSVFDIALQYHGTVNSAFDIARDNGLSIDAILTEGQEIYIETLADTAADDKNINVVTYYLRNGIIPATGYDIIEIPGEGIGYWAIDDDFIVSDNPFTGS